MSADEPRNKWGAVACLGCGFCCRIPCTLSLANGHTGPGPCRFLARVGEQMRCGLYLRADDATKILISLELYFGEGCCSSLFNEARDKLRRR